MAKARQAELTRDLAEGIASGRFPVGTLLPTEFELCDRYDASRYTGIQFKVKSATNRTLLFIVQTPETAADFSHMRASVTIPTDFMTVQVPFSTLMKAGYSCFMRST